VAAAAELGTIKPQELAVMVAAVMAQMSMEELQRLAR
jgi:hypothetical protein